MCAHKSGDVPCGTIENLNRWFGIAGHLAAWAAMYAVGVAIILGEFLDRPIGGMGLVYVALCAHSGYLFDRIKFRDADLDPADLMADPIRHGFLRRWAKWLRILMVAEWIGAVAVGVVVSPVLGGMVLGGVVAGYVYSGWRPGRGARLKDLAGLKAGLVASAVVGLGLAAVFGEVVWAEGFDVLDLSVTFFVTIFGIWLIVCGDAVICDLDDAASDEAYLTRSLPVMMGMRRAALVAVGLLVAGGLMVVADAGDDVRSRALFAGMVAVSGLGIMRQGKDFGGRRDWIDGRMLIVVLCTMLAGMQYCTHRHCIPRSASHCSPAYNKSVDGRVSVLGSSRFQAKVWP